MQIVWKFVQCKYNYSMNGMVFACNFSHLIGNNQLHRLRHQTLIQRPVLTMLFEWIFQHPAIEHINQIRSTKKFITHIEMVDEKNNQQSGHTCNAVPKNCVTALVIPKAADNSCPPGKPLPKPKPLFPLV